MSDASTLLRSLSVRWTWGLAVVALMVSPLARAQGAAAGGDPPPCPSDDAGAPPDTTVSYYWDSAGNYAKFVHNGSSSSVTGPTSTYTSSTEDDYYVCNKGAWELVRNRVNDQTASYQSNSVIRDVMSSTVDKWAVTRVINGVEQTKWESLSLGSHDEVTGTEVPDRYKVTVYSEMTLNQVDDDGNSFVSDSYTGSTVWSERYADEQTSDICYEGTNVELVSQGRDYRRSVTYGACKVTDFKIEYDTDAGAGFMLSATGQTVGGVGVNADQRTVIATTALQIEQQMNVDALNTTINVFPEDGGRSPSDPAEMSFFFNWLLPVFT